MPSVVAILECPNCGAAFAPNENKCGYCKTLVSVNSSAHTYGEEACDRAIAEYTAAIKRSPGDSLSYHNRGFAYECKGDYERALADYTEAIRLNPGNSLAYRRRARSLQNKGDYQHALSDVNEAVRLNPEDDIALSLLVGTKRTLDALGGIKQTLDSQTAIQQQSSEFLEGIRKTLDPYGISRASEAIQRNPTDAAGYWDRANGLWERATTGWKNYAGAYAGYLQPKDKEILLGDLSQAIKLDPRHVKARLLLSELYTIWGQHRLARAECECVLQMDPTSREAQERKEKILYSYRHTYSWIQRMVGIGWN